MRVDEIPGFHDLAAGDKLKLAEEIWAHIAAEPEALPVPESHKRELAKRLERYRDNPESAVPLDEFARRIRENR